MKAEASPARPRWTWPVVAAGYLALAAVVTAPAFFDLDGWVIGTVESPGLGSEFLVQAHTLEKFRAGDVLGFFHSDLLLDPRGQDFAPSIGIPLHLAVVPAIRALLGPYGTYNAMILLLLVCNGLAGAWFLVRRGVKLPLALVGGAALMLSPYFLLKIHLGFPVKLVFFWCVLYTDALLTLRRTASTRSALIAVGFLVGALTAYPQYVLYLGVVSAMFVVHDLATRHMTRGLALRYGLVVALILPTMVGFAWFVSDSSEMVGRIDAEKLIDMPSVDAGRFWRFFPMENAPAVHRALPMKISPVLLALFAVGVWRAPRGEQRVLALCAAVVLLFSLGPFLQVFGHHVPLPFYLLYASSLPEQRIGFPLRVVPVAMTCLLPVALLGLQRLLPTGRRRTALLAAAALLVALLVESWITVPELFRDVVTPAWNPAYVVELRRDDGGVLHVPTLHDKVPEGVEPPPPHRYSLITALTERPQANPLRADSDANEWLMTDVAQHPDTPEDFVRDWAQLLAGEGVTTLAVHRQYRSATPEVETPLDQALRRVLGQPFEDPVERVDLYALEPSP